MDIFYYMGIFKKIFGDPNDKILKEAQNIIEEINKKEPEFEKKSPEEFKELTKKWQKELRGKKRDEKEKYLNEILPEAFAAVREAAKKVLEQRHYDVQLIGGIILHRGQIAEMKTGEGKTLVATLPLYLNALTGRGVQLVTVNDYLSRVGAGWMAPVYYFLGLTTAVIIHDAAFIYDPDYNDENQYDKRLMHFRPITRQEAYNADILYGTNNEFGFDYLRDNMAPSLDKKVQRELNYAIVDEIDSILIDEARTPLIISSPAEESTDKYVKFAQLVLRLTENEDYKIDEKMRAATLTENGILKMEKWLGVENIYTAGGVNEAHHIEQALKAHTLFKLDRDYVVKDGEIIIVDEFTGRLMHGRRYSEGLHQAIEAKEGVKIQRESQTLATITFQNYFRIYKKLAGMTGTALTEAEEFSKIYKLEVVSIPTHKPMIRKDLNDLIYKSEEGKFQAITKEVKERHEKGQPVLIGTISIEKNEYLAQFMEKNGLHPQILNAKHHEKEARIIAEAGRLGAITIATNMAGRGVDIILGGAQPPKDDVDYKRWTEENKKVVEAGGLHVIGTERHEARRIDNQLRGRAGRQGDPGSSQFYISTDDDLARIFGGDRMKNMMNTLRMPDDMPIENRIITKAIESAQKKVEGNNFDTRKHLVEYDDVINKHREAIYRRRNEVLKISEELKNKKLEKSSELGIESKESAEKKQEKNLSDIILEMVETEIEQIVNCHTLEEQAKDWNLAEIYKAVGTIFPVENEVKGDLEKCPSEGNRLDQLNAKTKIIECLMAVAKKKYGEIGTAVETAGINWNDLEKSVLLRAIDSVWIEHLEAMASMRQGIGLRGYGQRDPLVEYKKEAYKLYNELNNLIQKEVVYSIYRIGLMHGEAKKDFSAPQISEKKLIYNNPEKIIEGGSGITFKKSSSENQTKEGDFARQKVKNELGQKVGRNDLCPCGSGKKYKKCHGK